MTPTDRKANDIKDEATKVALELLETARNTAKIEVQYSNRELDAKFKNTEELIRNKHDDVMIKVNEVLLQTRATNGSVASLKMWRGYTTGAVAVIIIAVLPLLTWALIQIVHNNAQVSVLSSQMKQLTK